MTRLARSLATLAQPSASRSSTSLIPPYSHSLSEPKTTPPAAFKPPYSHSLPSPSSAKGKLAAPYRFTLVNCQRSTLDAQRIDAFNAWTRTRLDTDEGRQALWAAWVGSVNELEKVRSSGNRIPEISFRDLSEQLKSSSTVDAILGAGTFVVRDVVADREAEQWFRQILDELNERQGRASFWSSSLLAARAHTSVLSANNQVLSAVTGCGHPCLIQADTAQAGIAFAGARTTTLDAPWTTNEKSLAPTTPLLAHLALTAGTPGRVAPTMHAAIYASLRPLFVPARSKISFYDTAAYLDPANWKLVTPDAIPQYGPDNALTFPHLDESSVVLPEMKAGDIIYRHVSIPISLDGVEAKNQGGFLPITPLPRVSVNETYIAEQRQAFEQGLPPPHARGGGLVALEDTGSKETINSSGGRRAMGY